MQRVVVVANCNEWLRGPLVAGLLKVNIELVCIDVRPGKKKGTIEFLSNRAILKTQLLCI